MYLVKKKLFYFLFCLFTLKTYGESSYVSPRLGYVWENGLTVDSVRSKSDPQLIRKSIFDLNSMHGVFYTIVVKKFIKSYFAPRFSFSENFFLKGKGTINTFDIKNNEATTVESIIFSATEKVKLLGIANEAIVKQTRLGNVVFELDLHTAYKYSKSLLRAKWSEDSSKSCSESKGFTGGLKSIFRFNSFEARFYEYITLSRVLAVSQRDNFLGVAAGSVEFVNFSNLLKVAFDCFIYKNVKLRFSFAWTYQTKIKTNIIQLDDIEVQGFTDPKLLVARANSLEVLWGIVVLF